MNGFERFGIDHLSASSINMWTDSPSAWVAKYLLKKRFPFGPAAERGKAVEQALVAMLLGESHEKALSDALAAFDRRFMIGTPETTRERDMIADMAKLAFDELAEFGAPEFPDDGQEKIQIAANFGDWSIPVIGFLDLVFPEHGRVVDLKTTSRIPSAMSQQHRLQRAIYSLAKGNMDVSFLYVSPKKAAWLADGDPREILARAKTQIARMEAFLRHCPDPDTAAGIVPVDPASFYWRGAEPLLSEIYGL